MELVKPYDELTDEQKKRLSGFVARLVQGQKVRQELATKTDIEITESLMRLGDDMVIESPQAILIEVAAERLGYTFDEGED